MKIIMREEQKELIEQVLEQATHQYPVDVVLEAIREVYGGKLWIVGGFISSIAIPLLYNYKVSHHTDLDILLAESIDYNKIDMPKEWIKEKTFFGSPRFKKDNDQVDIWCLTEIETIKKRRLKPILDSYLKTVPLTSQAIAYDIKERKIYGDIGLKSLETRTVEANDIEELHNASWRSAEDYLIKKAEKLKFTPILNF